ncbi:MAG TPA: peptidoglycan DD-metalloendopeptidase family protein [Vicinamibacterales bacterium]|jgi:septal ring factor EnvC (AmiA/AmiB activator)|nr:peptidoglycan DD-metalloendopeptidase family protein [Vicinamibacterales bacterium]
MKRIALALSLIALSVALLAQQADRDRAEALSRRASDRLQALQQEADRLASDERTLLGDLRKLEIAREIKAEELHEATARADESAKALQTLNDRVRVLEQEDVSERPQLRARIVELYKLGQGRYLRLLLSTSDVRNVGQASRMVAAMAKRDRDRVTEHERTLNDLKVSRVALQARSRTLIAARLEAEKARTDADASVAARNELIGNIDRERDLNAQLAGELTAAHQKLQATIRQMSAGAVGEVTSLPLRPFRGDLDWPVAGAVRQRFGRASNGIEIAADDGAPVQAVHEGTVAFSGPFTGFGNLIIVQHDADTFSLYGNLRDTAVTRGARVERGQTLGSVGASTTGPPGLYFELRVGGQPVDPIQWLKR